MIFGFVALAVGNGDQGHKASGQAAKGHTVDHCPRCGGEKIQLSHPKTQNWYCEECGRFFSAWTLDATEPETLGRYLCLLRGRASMTVMDVAQAVGVSDAFITMVERGRRRPSLPNLARWVTVLDGDHARARSFWGDWRKETPTRRH